MHIGKNIQKIVEASEISVQELANRLNTTTQNLYSLYKKKHVNTKYLVGISEILNIPINSFFGEKFSVSTNCDELVKSYSADIKTLITKIIIHYIRKTQEDIIWYNFLLLAEEFRNIKVISFRNDDFKFFIILRMINKFDINIFYNYVKVQKKVADWKYRNISNETKSPDEHYEDDKEMIPVEFEKEYKEQQTIFKNTIEPIVLNLVSSSPVYQNLYEKGWLKELYKVNLYRKIIYLGIDDLWSKV